MNIKIRLAVMALMIGTVLAGCASQDTVISKERTEKVEETNDSADVNTSDTEEEKSEVISEDSFSESDSNDGMIGEAEEPVEPELTYDDAMKLYEAFLAGEAKVIMPASSDHGSEFGFSYKEIIPDGSECSLDEIQDAFRKHISSVYEMTEDDLAGYEFESEHAYIDCGADGMPELLVTEKLYYIMNESVLFMIIKADGNQLKLCYNGSGSARSSISVNEFGYVSRDGSGGASYHYFEHGFVDADGNWHFLYGNELTSSLDDYAEISMDGKMYKIPDKVKSEFKDIAFLQVYFDEAAEEDRKYTCSYSEILGYDENNEELFAYSILSRESELFDEDGTYMKTFKDLGIDVVPMTKIDEMAAEKERKEGFDPELRKGKVVLSYMGE